VLNNSSFKFQINNLNTNVQEILIEYGLTQKAKNYLCNKMCDRIKRNYLVFQTQIITSNSIRIITSKLNIFHNQIIEKKTDKNLNFNEELIHTYNLKKISNLILENNDLIKAKENCLNYELFIIQKSFYTSDLSEIIIELIKRLPNKQNLRHLNDTDSQLLYNNKNLTSTEFKKYMKTNNLRLKYTNDTNNDKNNNCLSMINFNSNSLFRKNSPFIDKDFFHLNDFKNICNDDYLQREIADNFQFNNISKKEECYTEKILANQSLKMIMISLKMIKEATSICMKAKNLLDFKTSRSNISNNKNEIFLKNIFDNITKTEEMVNVLSKSSSVLVKKDHNFLNKMFEELNVYLELDLLDAMRPS
jgi:hypothetical protein